MVRITYNQDPR